jgi:hypothetical protein
MTYHYAEVIRNHVKSTRTLMPQYEGELVDSGMINANSYGAVGGAYAPAYAPHTSAGGSLADIVCFRSHTLIPLIRTLTISLDTCR